MKINKIYKHKAYYGLCMVWTRRRWMMEVGGGEERDVMS